MQKYHNSTQKGFVPLQMLLAVILGLLVFFGMTSLFDFKQNSLKFLDQKPTSLAASPLPKKRTVNAPYFSGNISYEQSAITWFGQVTSSSNYADARIGYNNQELWVNLNIFDRLLWYDTQAINADLNKYDATTLYLNVNGVAYQFVGQLNWWEPRSNYQAVWKNDGLGWVLDNAIFNVTTNWRGDAPLNNIEDRGWSISFTIPFDSLGLAQAPVEGSIWPMGMVVHDRDESNVVGADIFWPESFDSTIVSTWGDLRFGLPQFNVPSASPTSTLTIRQDLTTTVIDSSVGGHTTCGQGLDFFNQWGLANYSGYSQFNIQNQLDVADWPCFSKFYITFPLSSIPAGKRIVNAKLTMHQFGGSDPANAQPSYIQVLTTDSTWQESTINWNNAPLAFENISGSVVDPLITFPGWPGVPWVWDVSLAVDQAYLRGEPLGLVLYSGDSAMHSGKYFTSSDIEDWDIVGRPTLEINLIDLVIGDLNGDNRVGIADLSSFLSSWGTTNANADLDGNGSVGIGDLSIFLSNWTG